MQIIQSNLFKQTYKKLSSNVRSVVNENIKQIVNNPAIGVIKAGDLTGVYVHKFKSAQHLYLLAYDYDPMQEMVYLIALGSHQNFYDKVKKHLHH